MDSKFNSWSNNDPTDSFTSVLIDASMKVPPLTFSFHSACSDFPVCPVLDTLTPWYECWQKSLIENARVPPCSRFSGGSSHRNFDGRNSYNYRACGALRGEYWLTSRRFKGEIFCMYHCSLVACRFQLSPTSSSLCLLCPQGSPWHRSQDTSRHYSQKPPFTCEC